MVAVESGGDERRVNPTRLEQTEEEGGLERSTLVPGRLGGTGIRDRSRRGTCVARRRGDKSVFSSSATRITAVLGPLFHSPLHEARMVCDFPSPQTVTLRVAAAAPNHLALYRYQKSWKD